MSSKRRKIGPRLLEQRQAPGLALNPNAPSIAKQSKRMKHARIYIWLIVWVLTPLVALTLVASFANGLDEEEPELASSLQVNTSVGKSAANIGVRDWLAASPAPLPGGRLVSWDGFTVKEAPELPAGASESEKRQTYVEEVHHFTLSSDAGMFDAYALVHADPVNGSRMVGTPTIIPRADFSDVQWADEIPWFGFETPPTNVEITNTVEEWASAFASGSPATLKQAVTDQSNTSAYVPLSGVKSVKVNVTDTAVEMLESEDDPPKTWMLARVELLITWMDQAKPKDGETITPITYDLLINGIDGATPKVVSWGGVGTGASLTPFSVALQDVLLDEPQTTDAVDDDEPVEIEPKKATSTEKKDEKKPTDTKKAAVKEPAKDATKD